MPHQDRDGPGQKVGAFGAASVPCQFVEQVVSAHRRVDVLGPKQANVEGCGWVAPLGRGPKERRDAADVS